MSGWMSEKIKVDHSEDEIIAWYDRVIESRALR